MGFQFGIIMNLEYKTTFYCFMAVIFFVIVFEYFTEIMEYFLTTSPIYSRMIQMIYKELMLMGLLTFGVIMFETNRKLSEEHHEYIIGIDFTHVFLFFVTFFFVTHAFYLIFISMITKQKYYKRFIESIPDLINKLKNICESKIKSWCFDYLIFPISSIRQNVEFHLIHSVFMKTYLLPSDFNFPFYLSACFDRVALKSVKRSIFSWFLFILLVGVNCLRIGWGFSCPNDDNHCKKSYLHLFLICGIFLIGYTVCLNLVSRIYKSRLIRRIETLGVDNIQDCLALLLNNEEFKEEFKNIRMDATKLKEELEREFDILEEGEEEDGTVRYIAESLLFLSHLCVEFQSYCIVSTRVRIRTLLGLQRHTKRKTDINRKMSILSSLKTANVPIDDDSDDESADWEPLDGKLAAKVSEEKMNYIPLKERLKVSYYDEKIQNEKIKFEILNKVKYELEKLKSVIPKTFNIEEEEDNYKNNSVCVVKRTDSKLDEMNIEQVHDPKCSFINKYNIINNNTFEQGKPLDISGNTINTNTTEYSSNCFAGICCPSKKISPAGISLSSSEDSSDVFRNIFLFNKPSLFYRAIEFQIMCTCVYMALWSTNFLSIVSSTSFDNIAAEWIYQLLMVVPILISFNLIAYIAETYSLVTAISELNTEVVYQVLVDMELMKKVSQELRDKVIGKIRVWTGETNPDIFKQTEFVKALFNEVDLDGSGTIERAEFRMMLRNLNLTFSDHRFALLFRAADNMGGDGSISEKEFENFIFPGIKLPTMIEIRDQSIMRKSIFKNINESLILTEDLIPSIDPIYQNNSLIKPRHSLIANHPILNVLTVDIDDDDNKNTNSSDNEDDEKSFSSDDSINDEDDDIIHKVDLISHDKSLIRHSLTINHQILSVQTINLHDNNNHNNSYDTISNDNDDVPSFPSYDSMFDDDNEDDEIIHNEYLSKDKSLIRHSLSTNHQILNINLHNNNNHNNNSNDTSSIDNDDVPSFPSHDSMFDASDASDQEYSI